jgi:hypothetical protein
MHRFGVPAARGGAYKSGVKKKLGKLHEFFLPACPAVSPYF